ncbi:recQ-mediated genome instability protein 1 isoform X1 [Sebastes umbrosus]|uniref:recQ-mediated genome instability protein 1 isoform X1 n=1 Tax=Sebastes umbrosus TaxID=72105 RepID=UPI00189F0FC2|nr:recQ-mediated genome instability protein 1 isoform X1 [Sebastes umbrosus]XP_037632505.1 recQ-mediated genome instability protein 1 isoform X1 [Sebastes umbrosus]XP_037632506.1 recQ-mediated genome instability protein 1 isoform X1 [Sebastes umbrosus]XP_037632508.1 recQ-mediated genome instability protein 1 isoform X1 [Sebastes umbrosus]
MAPDIQAVVRSTQAWLQSSWHVLAPFAWLEACVEWLQEEAGGVGRLSQQQINQQALDQWLLTDLRDLGYPVLPEGLSQAQKTELNGTFCVQVDSVLDISQPVYAQMQKWKGSDCANDEVSDVTQATQRPWETRPTRMLLLQVTDGVQSLEAMEYQPVPALSTALRPGVKLQLRGQMVCRLGMLLLGPSNIKVLGGEVEDLVERNNQGRVLCRTLGLPEEQQEAPPAPQQGNQEVEELELDDAELLASLEAQEVVVARVPVGSVRDSGYGSLSEVSTQSSRSSSVRSLVSTASSRSSLIQSNRGGSVQGRHHGNQQEDSDLFDPSIQQQTPDHNMTDEDFPDEDFDDLPLDELDCVIFQESTNGTMQPDSSHRSTPQNNNRVTGNANRATKAQTAQSEQLTLNGSGSRLGSSNSRCTTQKRDHQGCTRAATGPMFSPAAAAALEPSHELEFVTNDDFMDEDMDCFLAEVETGGANQLPVQQGPSRDRESSTSSASALTLTSPPFTYLRLLEDTMSKPQPRATEIRVKAFIVTLLGKLSSSNGLWRVCATISDGTGYLDAELSDEVLTGLLGFSVAGKAALKRDPARRGELDSGMRRCQEGLVDMCCVMTIVVEPDGSRAVVTKADPVNEKVFQELEQRARDRRK